MHLVPFLIKAFKLFTSLSLQSLFWRECQNKVCELCYSGHAYIYIWILSSIFMILLLRFMDISWDQEYTVVPTKSDSDVCFVYNC